MREDDRVSTTLTRRSEHHPIWRAARVVLRQAAPSVLVVLVAAGLLLGGLVVRGTWSGTPLTGLGLLQGTTGVANLVWVLLGLTALLGWARAVRTAVPVLVAGGITRRDATGGFLAAAVVLGVAVPAALAVVGLAGGALQRGLTTSWHVPPLADGGPGYVGSMKILGGADPTVYFTPGYTLPWFVLMALAGVLLGAVWYRWNARGSLGVAVVLLAVLVAYRVVVSVVAFVTSSEVVDVVGGSRSVTVGLPCLLLALAAWLVLRRVPLNQPAR